MANFIEFGDDKSKLLLRSIINSKDYDTVLCSDAGYWKDRLIGTIGVLCFSDVVGDRYALKYVDAKDEKIYSKSGLIGLNEDPWDGENPFSDGDCLVADGKAGDVVEDVGGTAHAELEGSYLATTLFVLPYSLKNYILLTDNEGVYTRLRRGSDQSDESLDKEKLKIVREAAVNSGGSIGLVRSHQLKICHRLNRVPVGDARKLNICNLYRQLRRYSTSSIDHREQIRLLRITIKDIVEDHILALQAYAAAGTVYKNYAKLMILHLRQACDHPLLVKGFNSGSARRTYSEKAKILPSHVLMGLLDRWEAASSIFLICSEPAEDAVVAICGHVFCYQCVVDYLNGDDTLCPARKCKEHLSDDVLFSEATLTSCVCGDIHGKVSNDSDSSKAPSILTNEYSSSEIKAALEILLAHSEFNSSCIELDELGDTSTENVHVRTKKMESSSSQGPLKTIVFSQWTRMLDLYEYSINQYCIQCRRLLAARDRAVREFNTSPECKISKPERVVSDIASLFRDACLTVKSIDAILDNLYTWEMKKSGTVGEENRSTIEANRIPFTNNDWDLIKKVKLALRSYDEVLFINCVKRSLEIERDFHLSHCSTFSPCTLLTLLCTYRAVNCAHAFVQGQAGFFPDNLNDDPDCGLPPLHLAAQNLSSGVTEAFLMAGADPNLCCLNHDYDDDDDDGHGHDDIANLPLSLALEGLSCNPCVADWSVDKSVVKLIYILCLEELKEPLDTIRILASRTQALEKLSLQYAQKGQVVQLTVLLLVAWNKLVTPYVNKQQECCVEHCPVGQCIMNELQSLSSNQLMTTAQCTSGLVKLKSAWKMLKLLESKYHQIDNFHLNRPLKEVENHEVPCIVSMSTGIGGPEDVKCDDIQCLMPRLNTKQKVWLDRALQTYSGPPAVSLFGSRKCFAATTLLSKSFHNPTKVEKPAFRQLLPTARTCAYLVSMAKRRLK